MKPYTSDDNKGRRKAGDDIPRAGAKKAAKVARHAARQAGMRSIRLESGSVL